MKGVFAPSNPLITEERWEFKITPHGICAAGNRDSFFALPGDDWCGESGMRA